MTTAHVICFAAIWTALVLFTFDGWRSAAARAKAARAEA
jgi:EamA domain-containing membrane protein RarD